ncbi:hypothetical protein B0J13DRAFT_622722 [Dactylonectria estremocensis]|uniref:Uncharacterized protein n=1 Tax=Dactylonectria estremocensis TaxID=1079267 RepID=A0A9P9EUF2_9HYPO|nr:hypothetical protein B0J13DRAFT_622722 [Dactylonectria estremocensis]
MPPFTRRRRLARNSKRAREAQAQYEAEQAALPEGERNPVPEPPRRESVDLDLARHHSPDERPQGRRNAEGQVPAREAGLPDGRRVRQDFLARIPREITDAIFQEACPRGSLIVASASPDIDIEQMAAAPGRFVPLWIRYALNAIQWPIWGQALLDRSDFAISPMTMQYAIDHLLPATLVSNDMRNMIHSTLGVNDNVFVFTNTYSCWSWVKEFGSTYIPFMKKIYIIFGDSWQTPQVFPPFLHDEMEAVLHAGQHPDWQMGSATADGNYVDENFLDVPNRNIKPAAIAEALLHAGAAPEVLAFAYITEYQPEGSIFFETVHAPLAKPLRHRHHRHDFRLAMNALRRIPTPNPLKFIYEPSVEPTEADAAAGWGNFYNCLVRQHEVYEVADLTNKTSGVPRGGRAGSEMFNQATHISRKTLTGSRPVFVTLLPVDETLRLELIGTFALNT